MTTKRNFEQTARIIRNMVAEFTASETVMIVLRGLALQFADEYQRDNPRFDRERFMTACGF